VHPDQQAAYDLMRERLFAMFGPGGSFRISLGRATTDDAVFVSTVADTIAWDVAAALEPAADHAEPTGRRANPLDPEEAEYRRIWKHVEDELLRRRNDEDSLEVTVPSAHSVHRAA
jgi:hypothetical protein